MRNFLKQTVPVTKAFVLCVAAAFAVGLITYLVFPSASAQEATESDPCAEMTADGHSIVLDTQSPWCDIMFEYTSVSFNLTWHLPDEVDPAHVYLRDFSGSGNEYVLNSLGNVGRPYQDRDSYSVGMKGNSVGVSIDPNTRFDMSIPNEWGTVSGRSERVPLLVRDDFVSIYEDQLDSDAPFDRLTLLPVDGKYCDFDFGFFMGRYADSDYEGEYRVCYQADILISFVLPDGSNTNMTVRYKDNQNGPISLPNPNVEQIEQVVVNTAPPAPQVQVPLTAPPAPQITSKPLDIGSLVDDDVLYLKCTPVE